MKNIILTTASIIMVVALGTTNAYVYAYAHTSNNNKWSDDNSIGFQDGVADCASGASNNINGHSNAGHHSEAYMKGYNSGLNNCSDPSATWVSGNNQNQNQNNRNQAQSQGTEQRIFCVNVFGNCPTTSGQSQGLGN